MDRPPLIFCECCGRGLPIRSTIAEEQPHRCPRCGRNVCRACLHSGFHLCLTCLRQATEELDGMGNEPSPIMPLVKSSQICPTCHRLICDNCWSKQGFPRCGDCPKNIESMPIPPPLQETKRKKRSVEREWVGLFFLIQFGFSLLLGLFEVLLPHFAMVRMILTVLIGAFALEGLLLIFWKKQSTAIRP